MKRPFWRRRTTCILVAIALLVVLVLTRWELTRRRFDLDVNSGRTREQSFVLGWLVRTRISDTPFSKLADEFSLSQEPPDWRFMSAISYCVVGTLRECGVYGQAAAMCKDITTLFDMYEVAGQEYAGKRDVIQRFLQLMQKGELDEMREEMQRMSDDFFDKG